MTASTKVSGAAAREKKNVHEWLLERAAEQEMRHRQRGYVCMIEEFGERPVNAGEHFIVGYFDSIEDMERVDDQHKGHSGLEVSDAGWKFVK